MRRVMVTAALVMVSSSTMLIGASGASAASGWWHLTSGARPTSLHVVPGKSQGSNEVQQLKVSATGGEVVVVEPISKEEEEAGTGSVKLAVFGPTATHEEVQTALEGIYGAGNVDVSGGPGDPTGSNPYVVTFAGELAAHAVGLMDTVSLGFLLEGTATVTQLNEGRAAEPDGRIVVTASNLGDASMDGETTPVTITDKLPPGLQAVGIEALAGNQSVTPGPVECSLESLTCTFAGVLPAYDQIEVQILVDDTGASSGEVNEASVAGGEAQSVSVKHPITVSNEATPFGVEGYELTPEEEGGVADTQAGSHPFQLTTTLSLNQTADANPAGLSKDTNFKWPPGLIGNPTSVPRCTLGQFLNFRGSEFVNSCPPQTAVGVAMITINEPAGNLGKPGADEISTPIFNLEPAVGEPARFGFLVPGTPVFIDASVRTGTDYGITVQTDNISQTAALLRAEVTVWGTPGDPRHDGSRGNGCVRDSVEQEHLPCQPLEEQHPSAFLSLPTSCAKNPVTQEPEALQSTVEVDSWANPGVFVEPTEPTLLGTFDGCNRLPFSPSISLTPGGQAASTPTGLTTDVHVPQEESENPNGLAEGDVKDITVALPEGLVLNPSAADGLSSCTEAQVGFTGTALDGTDLFNAGEASCPDASKVGNVTIKTPVLANPLKGFVYLASPQNFSGMPQENPFESLVAMYLVARDPQSGVLVKLPGSVSLSATGQITATFKNTPQVPFEDAELEFFGGDRAPLATPAHCGLYTTSASFMPWSGGELADSTGSFQITSGANGSACPGVALPFAPSLAAGTISNQAGGFSQLTTTIGREDGQQDIQSVKLHMPAGLSGVLSGVRLCPEALANAGTCGPESLIGHTIVSVGLGGDPFSVTGGEVFLTEQYAGAPFGLSIVNPAVAGPFNLGKVVVRAKIEVDPHTTQLTITTDGSGPYAIPSILDGIPLQIKHVNVTIDRPGFTFNPTNCGPQAITGAMSSAEGAASQASVPFQVTNCAALKFAPKFAVSTSGKTSKADGASLSVKLTYPKTPQGTEANIARVKVDLPKQLPSRLTTLQKACLAATFEANPTNCPAASVVGHAKAITPILPVPLEGPAYFVSHGGEAFPSLIVVLHGYGVTVDLVGTTFISKAGITSSTFKTVPDVPVGSFELNLPQGKYSALAANGNLCKAKLAMPTAFVAQNGTEIHESTKVATTGCPKTKKAVKKKKSNGRGEKGGKKK